MLKERFIFKKDIPIYGDDPSPAISLQRHAFIEEHNPKPERFVAGPAITRLAEFEELGMEPDELMEMIRECKAAHATKLLECKTCGMKFEPTKERHYVVTKGVNMFSKEVLLGDAFDCPKCGCQMVVGERKFTYEEEEENA